MRNIIERIKIYFGFGQEGEATVSLPLHKAAIAIHHNNLKKGFYDVVKLAKKPEWTEEDRITFFQLVVNEKILMLTTEISEMVDELRQQDINWKKVSDEYADILVRLLDIGEFLDIDIENSLVGVMERNLSRPRKHGKRF